MEVRSGHYVATSCSREYAVGCLNMHRDGYSFLISLHPLEGINGDIFISPESAANAMHGDIVVARIARIEAVGQADGEILRVLKRVHPTVVGEFRILSEALRGPARRARPAVDRNSGGDGSSSAGPAD